MIYDLEADAEAALIRRAEPFDRAFYDALSSTLGEWLTPEDEEAFGDL